MTLASLIVKLVADTKAFTQGMSTAELSLKRFTKEGKGLKTIGSLLKGGAVLGGATIIVGKITEMADAMQGFQEKMRKGEANWADTTKGMAEQVPVLGSLIRMWDSLGAVVSDTWGEKAARATEDIKKNNEIIDKLNAQFEAKRKARAESLATTTKDRELFLRAKEAATDFQYNAIGALDRIGRAWERMWARAIATNEQEKLRKALDELSHRWFKTVFDFKQGIGGLKIAFGGIGRMASKAFEAMTTESPLVRFKRGLAEQFAREEPDTTLHAAGAAARGSGEEAMILARQKFAGRIGDQKSIPSILERIEKETKRHEALTAKTNEILERLGITPLPGF